MRNCLRRSSANEQGTLSGILPGAMITTGTVREKQIELDHSLDMPVGTRVEVFVRPLSAPTSHEVIGLFADDAELLDTLVEEAMQARETRPWRIEHE